MYIPSLCILVLHRLKTDLSDNSSAEYINFEAEQKLFHLFNPRAGNPRAGESNPTNPKPKPKPKKKEKEYVQFKLFDENGNRNWIKFYATDIGNAYLEATMKEKLVIIVGPDFQEFLKDIFL